jgi:tRNA dimethylallyltransferase
MDGLSLIPETPEEIRKKVIHLHNDIGTEALFQRLQNDDPETASQIDPQNPMRIMRAMEVLMHTGKPLAEWQKEPLEGAPKGWNFHVTAIFPDRETLIQKINHRLSFMMDMGILDEVKSLDTLIQNGEVPEDALIVKAHGFRSFRRYLNGEWDLEQAIEYTQTETRQYAKRQMTWIKNQIAIDTVLETA